MISLNYKTKSFQAEHSIFCYVIDCPEKWLMFDSKCYRQPEGIATDWADAESMCQNMSPGAHLASIHSREEQKFVEDNFPPTAKNPHIWLGGSDTNEEGSWVWTDGSSWDYTSWTENEPNNNHATGENCLLGHWGDGWNDINCDYSFGFLCQAPIMISGK